MGAALAADGDDGDSTLAIGLVGLVVRVVVAVTDGEVEFECWLALPAAG